jgi:hypothetical protein
MNYETTKATYPCSTKYRESGKVKVAVESENVSPNKFETCLSLISDMKSWEAVAKVEVVIEIKSI